MKTLLKTALLIFISSSVLAQSAEEIVNNYIETIGGYDKVKALKGIKISAKVNQGGVDIPLEIVSMADGRQYTKVSFQGMEIMQGVFDGESMWSTNFQSMKPEKADAESSERQKLESNDFPMAFLDYKEKGYGLELMGTETIEGTETFKLKLTQEPIVVDGEKKENVSYHYFDTEAFIPLVREQTINQGPQKGQMGQIKFSDYDEVDGLIFAFSMSQGIKGGPSQVIQIESIELNPEISDDVFKFPEVQEGDK